MEVARTTEVRNGMLTAHAQNAQAVEPRLLYKVQPFNLTLQ